MAKSRGTHPLSITLMLTDEDKTDSRIEMSVNKMLEEYVW